MPKELAAVWLEPEIKELAIRVAEAQGLTLSEYIRNLVTNDLDRRTFFTTKVKQDIASEEVVV